MIDYDRVQHWLIRYGYTAVIVMLIYTLIVGTDVAFPEWFR